MTGEVREQFLALDISMRVPQLLERDGVVPYQSDPIPFGPDSNLGIIFVLMFHGWSAGIVPFHDDALRPEPHIMFTIPAAYACSLTYQRPVPSDEAPVCFLPA
jgi:hypothetical protein